MKNTGLQTECGKALGLHILLRLGFKVRQQVAQLLPPLSARSDGVVAGNKQPEIVAQAAINRILEVQFENFVRGLALWLAAGERTLRSGKRDGVSRRCGRSGRNL